MTIPRRRDAARLLRSLEPPEWFLRHSCAVADVATWLASRAAARGLTVDRELVATAALLHDVDKLPLVRVRDHPRHGEGSAAWLSARGWAELGSVVREHPVTRLGEAGYGTWAASASLEARIVAYADKRAGQRLEPMEARFASWRRRYPDGPGDHATGRGPSPTGWSDDVVALLLRRALDLERDVCSAAGVMPRDVRRLRWSRRALRHAA
jgi:putative nucleotidyltransferase with HDIG domain